MILNFDFDLPCWTLLKWFSRGSNGGLSGISLLRNMYNKYQRKIPWKNYDDWFINGEDINYSTIKKKTEKRRVIEV